MLKKQLLGAGLAMLLTAVGCGGHPSPGQGDDQTPPTVGYEGVEAWLAAGSYKAWHCEAKPHDPRSPSPHLGQNRICSNNLLSAAGPGEYPVGSAAVKELYDSTGAVLNGYAVYLHTKAGTTSDTYYWYERVPLSSGAPHDQVTGVVADGFGGGMAAPEVICVGCHKAAGSDAGHSGHDYVYTQVR
jgi:hypothetical protein